MNAGRRKFYKMDDRLRNSIQFQLRQFSFFRHRIDAFNRIDARHRFSYARVKRPTFFFVFFLVFFEKTVNVSNLIATKMNSKYCNGFNFNAAFCVF